MTNNSLLILKNVKVLFTQFNKDDQFGRSITIDASSEDVQRAINEWYKDNKVGLVTAGRNKNESDYESKPQYREYKGVKQFTFKINRNIDPAFKSSIEGAKLTDVRYTSVVSLVVRAFPYDNNFGKGVSHSVDAIALIKSADAPDASSELELI